MLANVPRVGHTLLMNDINEMVAVPVGNFGPGFKAVAMPVSKHPFICECDWCLLKHADRLRARAEVAAKFFNRPEVQS